MSLCKGILLVRHLDILRIEGRTSQEEEHFTLWTFFVFVLE